MRAVRWVVAGLGLVGVAWVVGLVPGDSFGVTVDHCYVTYDRLENQHSRCVGHWTRAGVETRSGPVHGVPVATDWQVLAPEPDARYEWEVHIPDSAVHRVGAAYPGRAFVVPGVVAWVMVVVAVAAVVVLVRRAARRRRISRL